MTKQSSFILIRTQAALRIIKSLDNHLQEELAVTTAKLMLSEQILEKSLKMPGYRLHNAILDILSDTLQSALEAIDGIIPEEDGS